MRSRAKVEVETPQLSGRFAASLTPLVVLQACHIAELTGTLSARRGVNLVSVAFSGGEVLAADALDRDGLDALALLVQWENGRFEFVAGAPVEEARLPGPFQWLMLEMCRRFDEARAATPAGSSP